jgi:hypothetical protein
MNTSSMNTSFNLQDYLDMLSKAKPYDPTKCVKWQIKHFGVVPVDCIAVVCNLVVLYVWCADTRYSNTTYLFKMLAIDDLLAALFYIISQYLHYPGQERLCYIGRVITDGSRMASVNLTLGWCLLSPDCLR